MPQFDVYRGARSRGYLLDCQSDLLDDLGSRVVVPLIPYADGKAAARLHPTFVVEKQEVVMATHLIVAIPRDRLGPAVTSLSQDRYEILAAIDMLITGI